MRVVGVTHATKIGPNAPTITSVTDVGLNREFDNGAVDVLFTLPAVNSAVSYTVEASTGGTASGSSSPIRIQNLKTSTSTTFTIRGINSLNIEGDVSNVSSAIAVTTIPAKPDIGIAGSGNALANVPFSLSNNGGKNIVEYIVTGSPGGSAVGSTSPIAVLSLANGTDYTFTVVARNANGTSPASNPSNVVRPAAPVSSGGGGGGGGGVVTTTYYCYTSTCLEAYGSSQYLVEPGLEYISTSPSNSTTSDTSYRQTVTTINYCNTNQSTALAAVRQSACEGVFLEELPGVCTDPDTVEFGDCPAAGSFLWTTTTTYDNCNGLFYEEFASQAAWQTFTIYNCAGDVVDSGAGPTCSQEVLLSSSKINGFCGYTAPTYTSGSTGVYQPTGGGTPSTSSGTSGAAPTSRGSGVTVYTTSNIDVAVDILLSNPNYTELDFDVNTDSWVITVPNGSETTGGGGGGCFAVGTQVTMADGSLKNIEDLKLGDELRTFNIPGSPDSDKYDDWLSGDIWSTDSTDNFTITTTKVTHHHVGPFPFYFKINNKFKVTYEHLILINREGVYKFVQARHIKVGDKFVTETKEEIEVRSITLEGSTIYTVELDVEENDFYFADGILVHNLLAPTKQLVL